MSTPSHPAALALDAGTHALCSCGLSKNGAFCDGSHQGSGKTPHILKLDAASAPTTTSASRAKRAWWKFWG